MAEVSKTSPRRVLLEFIGQEDCAGSTYPVFTGRSGNALDPPGLGEVNDLFFAIYNAAAWECEGRFGFDCTHDFLRLPPGFTGYTNIWFGFSTPSLTLFDLRFLRACEDPPHTGYIYVSAGDDLDGDGFSDEWDLYPVPPNIRRDGEKAVLTFNGSGKGGICNFGTYAVPFWIHLQKL